MVVCLFEILYLLLWNSTFKTKLKISNKYICWVVKVLRCTKTFNNFTTFPPIYRFSITPSTYKIYRSYQLALLFLYFFLYWFLFVILYFYAFLALVWYITNSSTFIHTLITSPFFSHTCTSKLHTHFFHPYNIYH